MANTPDQALEEMIRLRGWVVEHRERCWNEIDRRESEDVEPIIPDARRFEIVHIGPSKAAFMICRRCSQRLRYFS
jgi:hypothetical protein